MAEYNYIKWFKEVGKDDTHIVGGKGANLGELTQKGLNVPPGFSVTADSYIEFINTNRLDEGIRTLMYGLNKEDSKALQNVSIEIRKKIINSNIPKTLEDEILEAYKSFGNAINLNNPEVAVRSSATTEDLPEASFAGQQDTYLHIKGEKELLKHIKMCWSSLWTSRTIYYREKQNFDHFHLSLSVVVQKMVNSEKSGVMFTANPINDNLDEMMINSSWGLGEAVVSGLVTPDEYTIDKNKKQIIEKFISHKKIMVVKDKEKVGTIEVKVEDILGEEKIKEETLSYSELNTLVNYGIKIEQLYGTPQDIEWSFDRDTKELYILQSRPITTLVKKERQKDRTKESKVLVKGLPASTGFGMGRVRNLEDIYDIDLIEKGDVIVATMTSPDMVPAMSRASAIITDEGGRTCHAAIVSRELQVPCIVSAKNASKVLKDGMKVSVDATMGVVYSGYTREKEENR